MKIANQLLLFLLAILLTSWNTNQGVLWEASQGYVHIQSDAPLEIIKAECRSMIGVIDPMKKTFAFSVRINSFQGFNSQTQRTHFLENYMEEKKFPTATFEGKFIEDFPFETPGTYSVRAKGYLVIHGITRERIIRGELIIGEHNASVKASFFVPVSDHGISIPKIVNQKIAEEIAVNIDIPFNKKGTP